MLYLLTQHSLWNRKHYPFLHCKCQRGIRVRDKDHEYRMLTQTEQVHFYDRLLRRWNSKQNQVGVNTYTYKHRMDWIDKNNHGCFHFGISPHLLLRQNIRLDTFHLRCAITRNPLSYLRKTILLQSQEVIESFTSTVISIFCNGFHSYVWNKNKSFSSIQGYELELFVENMQDVVLFLKGTFVNSEHLLSIITALNLWSMSKF